jgi:amidase
MSTFIARYDTSGDGIRLAVKDLIDLEGEPTSAGCRAAADRAEPAERDADCMAGAREAGARIVGKANLAELAYDAIGDNEWYGTPVNPLGAGLMPGGSSSGSAVAVGRGEADVAYGSDTGGSVRIPSACCGTVGLKTTLGRVPLEGVWPLSQSLDTIGPMAATVADVVRGMALLEPGFDAGDTAATTVGRLRIDGADPLVDAAVDAALAVAGLEVVEVELGGWSAELMTFITLISGEAWLNNRHLLDDRDGISAKIAERVEMGAAFADHDPLERAHAAQRAWRDEVDALFGRVELLALPTLLGFTPSLDGGPTFDMTALTHPFNVSGHPAMSLPVPAQGSDLPASLQLVGPLEREDLLCATAALVEAAASA